MSNKINVPSYPRDTYTIFCTICNSITIIQSTFNLVLSAISSRWKSVLPSVIVASFPTSDPDEDDTARSLVCAYRLPHIVVSFSSDKCTYCESLWIKVSAKRPPR